MSVKAGREKAGVQLFGILLWAVVLELPELGEADAFENAPKTAPTRCGAVRCGVVGAWVRFLRVFLLLIFVFLPGEVGSQREVTSHLKSHGPVVWRLWVPKRKGLWGKGERTALVQTKLHQKSRDWLAKSQEVSFTNKCSMYCLAK